MQGTDPFHEGRLAAARNEDITANPYDRDAIEAHRWRAGFEALAGSGEDGEPGPFRG